MVQLDEQQIKGTKDAFRAFVSGLSIPAVTIPFIYWLSYYAPISNIRVVPLYLIPIAWGIWNVVQLWSSEITIKKFRLGTFGAILGVAIASVGESAFNVHQIINIPVGFMLLVFPIICFFVWEYLVSRINTLVGLEE